MSILASLSGPADLRRLRQDELAQLCAEIRGTIIETVAHTGGHLGSSLGVVELTVALHRLLDSPTDRLVWDTGHQAYPHKLLTGRLERFSTLRQLGGVGGFPRRSESPHDVFDGGHAGTGLSIAEGLALARDERGGTERIVVVVGDAALISGLALEALNDIGHRQTRLVIVLNDNEMSISPTVGALSQYLSRIKLSSTWQGSKRAYDRLVAALPVVGPWVLEMSLRLRKSVVHFAQPGQLFEDLGVTYVGPVPGHDLRALDATLRRALVSDGPVLVHVRTQKGRGYRPAETDQVSYHGAALPPMRLETPTTLAPGGTAASPTNGEGEATLSTEQAAAARHKPPNYSAVMAAELLRIAEQDEHVVAITAGMPTGTGLARFQAAHPTRFYDVGIAEQHALTMATGLALGGMRPFVAIYSTFLQRAFDQTVHDVCQNDVPVVIGVDRAGLVGEDGTSHQGIFTIPAQRQLPNLVVASPRDEQQLRRLLRTAFSQQHPFALHYPRDPGLDLPAVEPEPIPVGSAEVLREGTEILIAGFGPIVQRGREVADRLEREGWSVALLDARFVKPLDRATLLAQARGKLLVVTLEESVVTGGFGAAVLEALAEAALSEPTLLGIPVRLVGLPADRFVDHGSVSDLRRITRLDTDGIEAQVREAIKALHLRPAGATVAARTA
ncbi:MAG TPA: 1-deoxy-D-xylulose-5-phosphate synthase [Candidatus Limnocylindrales bacterium]|nr:1-deoxy-D-xylulose-5-phosphate synthase [Candidatus Limnocylindrales bacterium]